MNKKFLALFLMIFFISLASASISLENELKPIYNLGEKINLKINLASETQVEGAFFLYLSCPNEEVEIYREYIYNNGVQKKEITFPLIKKFIGEAKGECVIESSFNSKIEVLSENFIISNEIEIFPDLEHFIVPGEIYNLTGKANLKNLEVFNGNIIVKIDGGEIFSSGKVEQGKFLVSLPVPDNFKSGAHKLNVLIYEGDLEDKLNFGEFNDFIYVEQIPTNLEIVLGEEEVLPGNSLQGMANLYDQSGEKIEVQIPIAIRDTFGETIDRIEVSSSEKFSYMVEKDRKPGVLILSAYFDEISNKKEFNVLENKEVFVSFSNDSFIITNVGNVPYGGEVFVKIGEENISIFTNLKMGESEQYKLSAPNGEYDVEIGGFLTRVPLTGNSINVEKTNEGLVGNGRNLFWIFIILILGFACYFLIKRARNRPFFGKRSNKKSKKPLELKKIPEVSVFQSNMKNKAELSLSINGTKQNTPMGCIYVKNYDEIKLNEGIVKETFEKISFLIGEKKGLIYQNQGSIFYFLPPVRTKTFDNEIPLLELTTNIKSILDEHNRKFNVKISYGVSLNFGTIVTSEKEGTFKFMSMGTLMTVSKKTAILSRGDLLMSDKFKEKISKVANCEKIDADGLMIYKFNGYINSNKKDYSKFINGFLERQKKENTN